MNFSRIRSFISAMVCLNHLSIVAYETCSGEAEINHYQCKDYIGVGGNITVQAPLPLASSLLFPKMFKKNLTKSSTTTTTSTFHQQFTQPWMKPVKLFSNPTITSCRLAPGNVQQRMTYLTVLLTRPSPLRVANQALDGCPTNPGFVFNKTAGLENKCCSACVSFQIPVVAHHKEVFGHIRIKLRTKAQSEFCSHSASVKRCSSVQKQSLAEQDVTDESDKVIDQIISSNNQANTTTFNIFPEDGAIPFTLNVTQAVDGNKSFDKDVATDQPIDGSSWMRLFAECLFGRIPSNLCRVSSYPA
ncbi:unnamed protein product [Clavelina lepadiformis]|uniref:Uncharacterized protein n=1 Tax=Clavelina lepadiformis TaxID=159417 RepID=A0ABP0G4G4_CLALP